MPSNPRSYDVAAGPTTITASSVIFPVGLHSMSNADTGAPSGPLFGASVRDLLNPKLARNSELVSLNALDELFALGMMELS
jgi:hypothetical protein